MFARAGLAISGSTLGHWVCVCGVRLQPLADALRALLLAWPVLHGDEMPVAMLKPGNGGTRRAHLWSWRATKPLAKQDDFAGGSLPTMQRTGLRRLRSVARAGRMHADRHQAVTAAGAALGLGEGRRDEVKV